tara:strand:- start:329 stop:553 length:225 start_codon:yes stop_codon:yes gene_type:complete
VAVVQEDQVQQHQRIQVTTEVIQFSQLSLQQEVALVVDMVILLGHLALLEDQEVVVDILKTELPHQEVQVIHHL